MTALKDILYKAKIREVHGSTDIEVEGIAFDSRQVQPGFVFVAVRGTQTDGHNFLDNALDNGAATLVLEQMPDSFQKGVTYVRVEDSAHALAVLAGNIYDNPSAKLKLVGVTGTNGKTSVVTLLHRLFTGLGYPCGLISTVENKIENRVLPSTMTTPDVLSLNSLLAEMVDAGCEYVFMEVSSHAIVQKRIAEVKFTGGVFTNITQDHLDYHKTFKAYIEAKKKFFDDLPQGAFALVNADDKRGRVMLQNTKASKNTFALRSPADFRARVLENSFTGLIINIDNTYELHSQLIGDFNAYNLLTVYAVSQLLEADRSESLRILSSLRSAEGRFDYFVTKKERIVGIVDYAHTPDALIKVLEALAQVRNGNETLITIIGCGGDRDKGKRPIMAKAACDGSNRVILTSDNPRSEDPAAILHDMESGLMPQHKRKALSILDRREAIKTACMMAASGDIILLAGKGHEKYQDIKGVKTAFDDKEILRETLKMMNK